MEIPDFIVALAVFYFIILSMIVIGAMSKYTSDRERETLKRMIKLIDNSIVGIGTGIFTGALVVIYYNWVDCTYISECKLTSSPNLFNIYYPLMIEVVTVTVLFCIILMVIRKIVIHKIGESEMVKCVRCQSLNLNDNNYCKKCGEPMQTPTKK